LEVLPMFSQQIPLQNHYFLTPYVYNPSLAKGITRANEAYAND